MTTIENVTREQVERLMAEAGEAGDAAQVSLCEQALVTWDGRNGWDSEDAKAGLRACVRAIRATEGMES